MIITSRIAGKSLESFKLQRKDNIKNLSVNVKKLKELDNQQPSLEIRRFNDYPVAGSTLFSGSTKYLKDENLMVKI